MTVYALKAPATSTRVRFQEAVRTIRAQGVKWYTNRVSCCNTCAGVELGQYMESKGIPKDAPVGWTTKVQGSGLWWDEDGEPATMAYSKTYKSMVKETNTEDTVLYVRHDNGAGAVIADAFRLNGFDVEWDGTDWQTVIVTLSAAGKN